MGTRRLWVGEDMTMILLFAFLLLELADAIVTVYGINRGLKEANPLMRKLFASLGLYGGLALMKLPVMVGAAYCVVVEGAGMTFMLLLVIPFAALLANNLYQIWRARKAILSSR
jgi:hypothetical protein